MSKLLYTKRLLIALLLLLLALAPAMAQDFVYVGETSALEVDSVPNESYAWELYSDSTVNFAVEPGDPEPMAYADFVGDSGRKLVHILWKKPGTYYFKVTAKDVAGCATNMKIGRIRVKEALPMAVITPPDPDGVCEGENVQLEVTLTGSAPWSFTYSANDGTTTIYKTVTGIMASPYLLVPDPKPLLTTEYQITTVTDKYGTNTKASDSIIQIINPLPETSVITLADGSSPTGSVCIGGTETYAVTDTPTSSYLWKINDQTTSGDWVITSTGHNSIAVSWNKEGSYILTVQETSDAGCTGNAQSLNMIVHPLPSVESMHDTTICYGNTILLANAKAKNYSALQWSSSGDGYFDDAALLHPVYTPGPDDLAAGKVTLTLVAKGMGASKTCPDGKSSMQLNILHLEASLVVTPITCLGANDGILAVSDAQGGSGNYEFSRDGGKSWLSLAEMPFRNLAKGSYEILMRDATIPGCEVAIGSKEVLEPGKLMAAVAESDATCLGNDGVINVTSPKGGWGNYQYRLNNLPWQVSGNFPGLVPGTYEVWIGDADAPDCMISLETITIKKPDPLTAKVAVTNVSCFGGNDGAIAISEHSGTSQYEYRLNDQSWIPQSASPFENLVAGDYVVQMRDIYSQDCVDTIATVSLTQPAQLMATASAKDISCYGANDGKITILTATGGMTEGNYEFRLNDLSWQSSQEFTGLKPATYTIWMRDAKIHTCEVKVDELTIVEPQQLTATVTSTHITCHGSTDGKIEITNAQWLSPFIFTIDNGTEPAVSNPTGLFTGLKAGVYNVKMSDKNKCEQALGTITIIEPDPLYADVVATDQTCLKLGTITISNAKNSFSGLYQYSIDNWKSFNTTGLFNDLTPGNYTVEIRDAQIQSCIITLKTVTIQPSTPLSASVKTSDVTCYGSYDGSLTILNQKGGSGQYQYSMDKDNDQWRDTPVFPDLFAGSYKVWMRDKISPECFIEIGAYEIKQPGQLTATPVAINVTCFGGSDGKISFNAPTGGSQPGSYEYTVNGTDWVSGPIENLPKGPYTAQMRDARVPACVVTLNEVIIEEPKQLTATVDVHDVKCFGEKNGVINITDPKNGSGAGSYLFSINGGSWTSDRTFTNLAIGDYTLEIKDALVDNCTATLGTYSIGEPAKLLASETHTHQTLPNVNDGSITIQGLQGGIHPYRYSLDGTNWQTEDKTIFNDLAPGTYTVLVHDANDCEVRLTVNILPMGSIRADYTAVAVTCNGGSDGSITFANPSGASKGNYQFSIDGGLNWQDQRVFSALSANISYSLKVRDADNTDNETLLANSFQLSQPAAVSATVTPTDESASGANDGIITISNYQGGSGGYQYRLNSGTWKTASGNDQIKALAPNVYVIDIQDKNGCISSYQIDVQKFPSSGEILATIMPTNACFGQSTGKLTISKVSGGLGNGTYQYHYRQNSQPTFSNWVNYTTTQAVIDNLAKGDYVIEISDGTSTASFTRKIDESPELKLALTQGNPIDCYGGEAFVNMVASGGKSPYKYYYNGNEIPMFAKGAGTYDITVVDANSCSVTKTITITQPDQIKMLAKANSPLTCGGLGSIDFTFTNVPNGPQVIWYKDGGKDVSKTINVKNNSGSLTLMPQGQYEDLHIKVNNCSSNDTTLILSDPSAPAYSVKGIDPGNCTSPDGQILIEGLTPNTPYSVSLDNGIKFTPKTSGNDGTITMGPLPAGTYQVVLKLLACTGNVIPVVLNAPTAPSLTAVGTHPLVCAGNGTIDFTFDHVADGKNYTILYTGGKFNNVEVAAGAASVFAPAGDYKDLKIIVNGCASPDGVNVSLKDPQSPTYAIKKTTNPLSCGGTEGVIVISGLEAVTTYKVTINSQSSFQNLESDASGEIQILGLSAGNYNVALSLDGCKGPVLPVKLSAPTSPTIVANGINPLACGAEGTIEFTFTEVPDGNYSILYKGGEFKDVPVAGNKASVSAKAGSYEGFELTVNGCPSGMNAQLIQLVDPDAPTYVVSGSGPLTCSGKEGIIAVSGLNPSTAYQVRWLTGAAFVFLSSDAKGELLIKDLPSGTYQVTLMLDQCVGETKDVILTDPEAPVLAAIGHDPLTCAGNGTIDFNFVNVPDGPQTITYDGGSFPVAVLAGKGSVAAPQGVYDNLKIRLNNCLSSDLVTVTLNDPPAITLRATATNAECYNEPGRIDFNFENVPDDLYTITYDGGQFDKVAVSGDAAFVVAPANTYANLRIKVNNCTSPAGVAVTLANPPAISFTAQKTNGKCSGDSVTFDFTFEQVPDGKYTITYIGGQFDNVKVVNSKAVVMAPYRPSYENFGIQAGSCSAVYFRKFFINYPEMPVLTAQATNPASCGLMGKIEFILTDVPDGDDYTITYNNGITDGKFENVRVANGKAEVSAAAGSYAKLRIWVNDCPSKADDAILVDPSAPDIPVVLSMVDPTCNVLGKVQLGSLPATGEWILGYENGTVKGTGVSATLSDLAPGTYHFTVTNSEGCSSKVLVVTIKAQPLAPVLTVIQTNQPEKCDDKGSFVLRFTNLPDGPYDIVYSNGSFKGVKVINGVATITADAGNYIAMQVKGADGCWSNKVDAMLVSPLSPQAPVVGNMILPKCSGAKGSVELSGLPKGNWILNPGNISGNSSTYTVTGLEANTVYNFTVTDEAGCISAAARAVDTHLPVLATPVAKVTRQPGCDIQTGTITVSTPVPAAGLVYVLTGVSPVAAPVVNATGIFDNLTPGGSYSIKVMDTATECASTQITLQINAMPANPAMPKLQVSVTPSCNNPDGTVMVVSPRGTDYQYSMDGGAYQGSVIFAGLRWGEHTVRVRNVKTGCVSDEGKITVPAIPPPPVITASGEDAKCFGGNGIIRFTVSGANNGSYAIKYNGGEFNAVKVMNGKASVAAPAGVYNNLVLYDPATGCDSENPRNVVSTTVKQAPAITIVVDSIRQVGLKSQNEGAIYLHVTGGTGPGTYSYQWDNGATTEDIKDLTNGTYTITVTDANNCSQPLAIRVPEPNQPPVAVDDHFTSNCVVQENVIENDTDPENDPLFIDVDPVVSPSHGTVTLNADGTFVYRPFPGFSGTDYFTYALYDKNRYPGITATVSITVIADFDHDGIADDVDLDVDGDGITNEREVMDGQDWHIEDTDKDELFNYMDIDADGDGIVDNYEAQGSKIAYKKAVIYDANSNGLNDAYDGRQSGYEILPIDTDGDGTPDFLDPDSDNDMVPDNIEGHDSEFKGKADHSKEGNDADGDGLDDGFDTVVNDCDAEGNMTGSNASMKDLDQDGDPNWRDDNDDDDDFLTKYEDMDGNGDYSNDDFDYDGHPEYLDHGRECDLFIPDAFSPDGDGVHEYFQIYCINHYPNAKMYIFDQMGNKLFEKDQYGNEERWGTGEGAAWWDAKPDRGRGRGEKVAPGTYYYVLDLGNGEVKKSFVFVSY